MKSLLPWLRAILGSTTLGIVALGAGCSSEGQNDPGGSAGTSALGGSAGAPSASQEVHGSVVVSLNAPIGDGEGYSALLGRFFESATPDPFPLALDTKEGECELKVPDLPFCSEACTPDVCTADDVCTPYPTPVAVGTLAVSGLGDALSLAPATSMVVYQSPSLAYPPCEEGAQVSATSDHFTLAAECITPLELTGADPLPVMSGEVVRVTWVPAATGAKSRIRIGLDVSHHGGKKGQIDCDVPDTGSFDIPEALVTKLISLGLAGFPTINVNRVSLGADANSPNVSLLLSSSVTRAVDTGITSCLDDVDCEADQTCNGVGICE